MSHFDSANTAKAIHATLDDAQAAIPADHKRALLIGADYHDGLGVRAVYVQRAADGWNVLLEGAYSGDDGPSAGFAVARSWK
jgi:hypothetical protein